ncbi:unnamed protein product [Cladocopium goreaui]|uniref:Uncharacterized protein n=1 Tax=Cladocopium goreaui TaxID=2562237 RepID=A0A9P1CDT5_9DINO|nr:unnamed protein product [Cladocopium goreaui]
MNQRDKTSARFHVSRSTVKRIFAHWSGKNSMSSVFQAFSEHTKNCPCLRKVLFSLSPRPIFETPDRANSATKSSQGIHRIPAAAGESLVSFEAPTPQEFTSWPARYQASLENTRGALWK